MNVSPPKSRVTAFALLILAMAFWGGNWVVARAVALEVPSLSLVFWRTLIFATLAYFVARRHLKEDWPVLAADWKIITLLAFIGVTGYASLGYSAVRYTSATNAALLANTTPFFAVIFSWLILRVTVSPRQAAGALLAFCGAVVIVSRGELEVLAGLRINPGDILMLIGVVFWALYSVLLHARARLRPETLIFATTAIATVMAIPGLAWEAAQGQTFPLTGRALWALFYLAVFPSLLAFICHAHAVRVIGANVATFFSPMVPVFSTIGAIIFLDETLAAYHAAGFACVGIGVVIAARK
ncbi:MAG: DMT family transporter [Burkholderiales bacterium]